MICLVCDTELREQLADMPVEVKGESLTIKDFNALVCPSCGFKTIRGSDMTEYMKLAADTYRRKGGLLTSEEIRSRRQFLGMSQEKFASYLEVGTASIKRWELGQIQDKGMDHLIRLVTSLEEAKQNYLRLSNHGGSAAENIPGAITAPPT